MKVLKSHKGDFHFLGNRKYVQGATLTTGLMEAVQAWGLGPVERVSATFHELLFSHGTYDLLEEVPPVPHEYTAFFGVSCAGKVSIVGLKENGEAIGESIPYDEEGLVVDSQESGAEESIDMRVSPSTPLINAIIAMNKRLLSGLFPREGFGQWFLARYDLDFRTMAITSNSVLKLKVAGKIGSTNVRSSIALDSKPVGYVYFSRKASG